MKPTYLLDKKTALDQFKASDQGLSSAEAAQRLIDFGPNVLSTKPPINPLKLLASQFKDWLLGILIIAAAISMAIEAVDGHLSIEGLLIIIVVIMIALIGFFNELKAGRTVEALKKLMADKTMVLRDGHKTIIESSELVTGDIVVIREGDKINADAYLISADLLTLNESSLTGESVPVSKNVGQIESEAALGDRSNMVHSGTFVSTGSGLGLVTATGSDTEIGSIAKLVDEVKEPPSPLQVKLDDLGKRIGVLIIGVCVIVFGVIFLVNPESMDISSRLIFAFLAAVALAVAAIPEGLAFVVRVALALGARRMAAKNALVSRLAAVEALGSTDIICSDKTGTLTSGNMTVTAMYAGGNGYELSGSGYDTVGQLTSAGSESTPSPALIQTLNTGLICNDAQLRDDADPTGDPTEIALLVSAGKVIGKVKTPTIKRTIPFSSERKMMSVITKDATYTKGAPDIVLEQCDFIMLDDKAVPLTDSLRKKVLDQNQAYASQALRVLGFAGSANVKASDPEQGLVFYGLQAMMDPPREEVAEVIKTIRKDSGINVIMITGDHPRTAAAVAQKVGLQSDKVITGQQLQEMDDDALGESLKEVRVFARVNPEHKLRIVQALQRDGHQVAMTGDGVNDAPALKAADIGVSMGITGTDAAKESADMILLDDNFITIVEAIREGRGIFLNIRKFINYLLSANMAEVLTVFGGITILGRLVVTAPQLLFINMVTDGMPAIALGADPNPRAVMKRPPSDFHSDIINLRIWVEMAVYGLLVTAVTLGHYYWASSDSHERAGTAAFVSIVFYQLLVRLFGIRADYQTPLTSNRSLLIAVASSISFTVILVYFGPLSGLFSLGAMQAIDWWIIITMSSVLYTLMFLTDYILDKYRPSS